MPRRVTILGSTGSIGTQTLEVAAALPNELQIVGLAAGSNFELLAEQIRVWKPQVAVLFDESKFSDFKSAVGNSQTKLLCGLDGLLEAATWPQSDVMLGAMMGAAGLRPTLAAIEAGKDVAIANKETLVAAGEIVMSAARAQNIKLWPVDSEHSALAQCLLGEDARTVEKLTITASGGPFWTKSREEIAAAKPENALKHPTWTMGRKITIDSATLMNKGLEMIEACHLFDVPMDKIEVVVHRQSIVHSFVSFCDGSVKAQLGVPDMKLPIQWGLLGAQRMKGEAPHLDLLSMGTLTFEQPDDVRFPSINLARAAMKLGGTAPAALNAANEVAVEAFLVGGTDFYGVTSCVEQCLERHENCARPALDDVLRADSMARQHARQWLLR
ncbi:MAG TPA: 1-deoxy-D-xylulose-5-phosphate reductoisomerase [Abditibacterium sp.]|jgi:1-deoxy-D-xylulose-5-phosphate reductoisomerase